MLKQFDDNNNKITKELKKKENENQDSIFSEKK